MQVASNEALQARIDHLEAALRSIAERKGPYNRDPLTHASNTINDMASTAVAALNQKPVTMTHRSYKCDKTVVIPLHRPAK